MFFFNNTILFSNGLNNGNEAVVIDYDDDIFAHCMPQITRLFQRQEVHIVSRINESYHLSFKGHILIVVCENMPTINELTEATWLPLHNVMSCEGC